MVNKIYYQVVSEKIKFLFLDMPKLWIKLSFRNWAALNVEVVSKLQIRFKGKAQADRESAAYA